MSRDDSSVKTRALITAMGMLSMSGGSINPPTRRGHGEINREYYMPKKDPHDPIQAEKIHKAEEKRRRKSLKRLKDHFSSTKNVIEFLDRELGNEEPR